MRQVTLNGFLCISVFLIAMLTACQKESIAIPRAETAEQVESAYGKTYVIQGAHNYSPEEFPDYITCDPAYTVCYVMVVEEGQYGVISHPPGIYMEESNDQILTLPNATVVSESQDGTTNEYFLNTPDPEEIYPGSWSSFVAGL